MPSPPLVPNTKRKNKPSSRSLNRDNSEVWNTSVVRTKVRNIVVKRGRLSFTNKVGIRVIRGLLMVDLVVKEVMVGLSKVMVGLSKATEDLSRDTVDRNKAMAVPASMAASTSE